LNLGGPFYLASQGKILVSPQCWATADGFRRRVEERMKSNLIYTPLCIAYEGHLLAWAP